MHFIYTLHALCPLVSQNFDFSGGAQWRQPLTTHEKSKSCGATAEHFQFFQSSISHQSSVIGHQNERNKTESTKRAAAAYGWVGRRSGGAKVGALLHGGTATAEQRSERLPRSLRSGCLKRSAEPLQWSRASTPPLCPVRAAGEKKILR